MHITKNVVPKFSVTTAPVIIPCSTTLLRVFGRFPSAGGGGESVIRLNPADSACWFSVRRAAPLVAAASLVRRRRRRRRGDVLCTPSRF